MRLGETYLLLAEAQFKQGKLPEAATTLNVIRGRSNATPVSAGDVTLDYILDERVRELVGEENRRMTLMRTKTLVERARRLNAISPVNQLTGIEDKHLLMPIPQAEINLNKDAELEQNRFVRPFLHRLPGRRDLLHRRAQILAQHADHALGRIDLGDEVEDDPAGPLFLEFPKRLYCF